MRSMMFLLLTACTLILSGCLSHYFLESDTRLQVENATEDCTLVEVAVIGENGSVKPWIADTILPGSRSRVVEADWVGEFTLRFKYLVAEDSSTAEKTDEKNIDLDGGSVYLVVKGDADSLEYDFR